MTPYVSSIYRNLREIGPLILPTPEKRSSRRLAHYQNQANPALAAIRTLSDWSHANPRRERDVKLVVRAMDTAGPIPEPQLSGGLPFGTQGKQVEPALTRFGHLPISNATRKIANAAIAHSKNLLSG